MQHQTKKTAHTIIYSAILLTGVNLLLRLVGMGFQVYLSGRIGAAGIGLLQLILSVTTLFMTAAIAGIRTTTMYLSAEALGKNRPGAVGRVLSGCFLYSIVCSSAVALGVVYFAPVISLQWIGNAGAEPSLRIFAAFLPLTCLCGVMTGYFTAANRIKALAAVEFVEQFLSIGLTVALLHTAAHKGVAYSCAAVVAGSSLSSVFTLFCLLYLRRREPKPKPEPPESLAKKLLKAAIPLAIADNLRMGLSTIENLIIPRRLGLYPGVVDPLASYGTVCGMVFPVLMFPTALLFGLAELLIPELSRCLAGKRMPRIRYLTARGLRVALLFGLACGGILFLTADSLGMLLYNSPEAGRYLRLFAPLAPMLYTDAITDAMTKGLGQQVACVRYNILTSFLDVVFLWILLPKYGIGGYYCSFVVTHALNFCLSIQRLLRVTKLRPRLKRPVSALLAAGASLFICGTFLTAPLLQCSCFLVLFFGFSSLLGLIRAGDFTWLKTLIHLH